MPLIVGFSGRQLRSTFCATSLEHQSTTLGRHPRAESVSASSFENARLICSLHSELSVCFAREPKRVRKRARILVVLGQTCNVDTRGLIGQIPSGFGLHRWLEAIKRALGLYIIKPQVIHRMFMHRLREQGKNLMNFQSGKTVEKSING